MKTLLRKFFLNSMIAGVALTSVAHAVERKPAGSAMECELLAARAAHVAEQNDNTAQSTMGVVSGVQKVAE
jgi:hypothetical protein